MREELPKAQKRHYRHLIGLAYERELSAELEKLHTEFGRWKGGELDAFELENRIHQFHQGPARELWTSYQYSSQMIDLVLTMCVRRGVVQLDEIMPEYREHIKNKLRAYEQVEGPTATSTEPDNDEGKGKN